KLATFRVPGRGEPLAGEVLDDRVVAFRDGVSIVDALARPGARELANESWPLPEVELLAPVPAPGTIYAIGLNYARHAEEQGAEVPDPSDLRLRTWVNGELRQDSRTSDLIFSCPELVEFISQTCTLLPGDLILTGTPSGVGVFMDPPQFLGEGDVVRIEIERL